MRGAAPHDHLFEYDSQCGWWVCVHCGRRHSRFLMPDPPEIKVTYL